MNRTKKFNSVLSEKLKNPKFAAHYLEALMEGKDGLSLEDALKIMIEQMGIKEFAELVDKPSSNIDNFIKGKRHPKKETLDDYLKPFGLHAIFTVAAA